MKMGVISTLVLTIFLLSVVSAADLGPFKTDSCVPLYQLCDTCTFINVTSVIVPGDVIVLNANMTNWGFDYTYEYCNTSINGAYKYNVCGDKDGSINCEDIDFFVNPTGSYLTISQMFILLFIFIIICSMLVFALYGINNSMKAVWQIFYVCSFYILLFSLSFLLWIVSNNYLYDVPLLASSFWIIWIILGAMMLPFVVLISSYILKKEAESLMEEDLMGQGYTREDAREQSKIKR